MALVSVSAIFHSLKRVLDTIVDDKEDMIGPPAWFKEVFEEDTMEDAYVDDLEMGGPGLMREKPEGEDTAMSVVKEGWIKRYVAKTFALGMAVTEEAAEDGKYKEVIDAAKRLKRSGWQTVAYSAANVFVRGFNSSYTGGDGVCLWSSSHTLPQGGTWSNTMATPLAPSVQAVAIATTQIRKFPGHDGLFTEGIEPECVVCPVDQWEAWSVITKSQHHPEPGQFNAINVVNQDLKLDVYPVVYWASSTTNWSLKTTADNGFRWLWRKKFDGRSWVSNEQNILKYSNRGRWDYGWSDPRCSLGVNA